MESRSPPAYVSYLLRLWRESDDASWRAALEDPHTGRQTLFARLGQLVAFLEAQTGEWICSETEEPHH